VIAAVLVPTCLNIEKSLIVADSSCPSHLGRVMASPESPVPPTQLMFDELPPAQCAAIPLFRQLSPWLQQVLGVQGEEASQEMVLNCEEDAQVFHMHTTVSSASVPVVGVAAASAVAVSVQSRALELPVSVSSASITTTVAESDTDIESAMAMYKTLST
jgi:hypothetical protein